jgi:hypothetical protein
LFVEKSLTLARELAYDPASKHEGGVVPDNLFSNEIEMPVEQLPTLDVAIESQAIRRLIEEVRAEQTDVPRSYNRTFNRHNR